MKGKIQTFVIKGRNANINGEEKKIFVYTPEDYTYANGQNYPVMLCFDGQNAFTECENYRHDAVDTVALDKILEEKNKKTVVIGINNGEGKDIRNRQLTLSPKFGVANDFEPDDSYNRGALEDFCEFLINAALPFVKEKYNLKFDHNVTSVGASSGGLAALYIGLKYPNIFCSVIALSPATCLFAVKDWRNFLSREKIDVNQKYLIYCGKDTEDKLEQYLYDCFGDDYYLSASKIKSLLTEYGIKKENVKEAYKAKAYHNERFWHYAVNDDIDFLTD